MWLSGFADEAGAGIEEQVDATRALGWSAIDLRKVDGTLFHELPLDRCRAIAATLGDAGIRVASLGSGIAGAGSSIDDDPRLALDLTRRCIERASLFRVNKIRVMSWPPPKGRSTIRWEDPSRHERIRRLKEICRLLLDSGLQPLHENCYNFGGQSHEHSLRLLESIPGLRLVFDTANPVWMEDLTMPEPFPRQSAWTFWTNVREHVDQLHIKDARWDPLSPKLIPCLPGEGEGDVMAILADARRRGFHGPVSIEPHLGGANPDLRRERYLAAGRRLEALLAELDRSPLPDAE
ncbi:MAG: sugar phosphate isomerase/epimerase [Opitutales bacterium]|nr:sugar phosphate isomerase/epimerase [Opitutales bacterium]